MIFPKQLHMPGLPLCGKKPLSVKELQLTAEIDCAMQIRADRLHTEYVCESSFLDLRLQRTLKSCRHRYDYYFSLVTWSMH